MKTVAFLLPVLFLYAGPSTQSGDLHTGDRAPGFELPWASRDTISHTPLSLAEMIGRKPIVLAFYPADWSGGCTTEMCTLRDEIGTLEELGTSVYGISGDYLYSHREWARHHNLPFVLLSDHFHTVAREYGVFNEESGYAIRSVFVIDTNGVIVYIDREFRAGNEESYQTLYQAVRNLQ